MNLTCNLCGWRWVQRGRKKPRYCPNCKRTGWDVLKNPEVRAITVAYRKLGTLLRKYFKQHPDMEEAEGERKDELPM